MGMEDIIPLMYVAKKLLKNCHRLCVTLDMF